MNAIAPISAATARLPRTYENAKTALASCERIDECKEWADKAAALASYAKQSEDLELERMAARIRARALRRAGELIKQIEPATGRNNQFAQVKEAGDLLLHSRQKAAADAGMSPHQAKQAVRVANIPEPEFTRQVESPNPPSITDLADQGTRSRQPVDPQSWLKGRDPKVFNRSMHFEALVERYAKEIGEADLDLILPGLSSDEARNIRAFIAKIDAIHDRIVTRI